MSTTKYIVNNLTGQTITGDLTINGNVVITGTTNTRPYKVFTALLTQNGESSTVNATSGLLIVGVSYLIDVYNAGDDFSNVGGPAAGLQGEWDGYSFIATGVTPNDWNNISQLQYNEGAPVATVLENTIGNIWFTYNAVGKYQIASDNLFISDKTFINNSSLGAAKYSVFNRLLSIDSPDFGVPKGYVFNSKDVSTINLYTYADMTNSTFDDSILFNSICIEIKIYN